MELFQPMSQKKTDYEERICPNCRVGLLYPIEDEKMIFAGWNKCEFCSYCKVIEKEIYSNRIKNQK